MKNANLSTTKEARVLAALQSGEEMTTKQIRARFGVANPTALITSLRYKGFPVYCNESVNSKGQTRNKFRLGTPSRSVVAAGYRALAAGLA